MTPDDYLWDRRGTPEPDLERLEQTLGPLAHDGRPLVLPEEASATAAAPATVVRPRARTLADRLRDAIAGPRRAALAFAALAVVAGGAWLAVWLATPRGWKVATLAGAPRVAERVVAGHGRLAPGQWLVTDAASRARLQVGDIGVVDVEPRTRVRLIAARRDAQHLAIATGAMRAIIVAPPRRFQVETPSARAVDLGCAYYLEVAPDGGTRLTVEIGWVSFEANGRESFVPAGAQSLTRPGLPPGTPCFTDAPAAVKNGLAMFDFGVSIAGRGPDDPAARRSAGLTLVLDGARAEDALTLWHLLARTTGAERGRVFDALAARVPPPAGVTRDGILAGDPAMLDRWWDALGYGGTDVWRQWRRPWGAIAAR